MQTVLERLGGGGHMMMAGAQIHDATIDEAKKVLMDAIEDEIKAETAK